MDIKASEFLELNLPTQAISQAMYREFLTTFVVKDKPTGRAMQMVRILGVNPETNRMTANYYTLNGDEKFIPDFSEDPLNNGVCNVPKKTVIDLLGNMLDDSGLQHFAKTLCAIYERINQHDEVKQEFSPYAHNDRRVIPTAKVNEEALRHMQEVAASGAPKPEAVKNPDSTRTLSI